jgi:putative Mn2+ efflux pump MntP
MNLIDIFLFGVGLSMDAFAVAICKGLAMRKVNKKQMLVIALFFGGFQALMPLIGYILGSTFASKIAVFDHWIAFMLLLYIGGKMVIDAIREWKDEDKAEVLDPPLDLKELTLLAIATSIDAFAGGISLRLSENTILYPAFIIGLTTFINSMIGFHIGKNIKHMPVMFMEIMSGIILISLGIKALF